MVPIHQAVVPILGAVAAEIAVGYLWYSNYAFGPLMRTIAGNKKSSDVSKDVIMHAIVALIKATALFILIILMQKAASANLFNEGFGRIFAAFAYDPSKHDNTTICALKAAGFAWLGFIFTTDAMNTIWGSKNWKKLLIVTSGHLAKTLGMAFTIALLS